MASSKWKFILADSKDLRPLGELTQARQRQISVQLNRAGSASFTMPMDADMADLIWPIESAVIAYRTGSTGTQAVWSGYVNGIDEDVAAGQMTVNCVGWLERFTKRLLRARHVFDNVDNGEIILELVKLANGGHTGTEWPEGTSSYDAGSGSTVSWPVGSSPNVPSWVTLGAKLPNEGSGGATAYVDSDIDKTFEQWQNVGQAFMDIIETENGPDVSIDPLTRILDVYRKKRRILPTVLGYGWGPSNVAQFNRQLDGSTVVTYHRTSGLPGAAGQAVEDMDAQEVYGPLEENLAISDVGEADVLLTYSQAEIAIRKTPRVIYSVTPFSWTPENSSPEPFVEYDLGDQILFRAVRDPRVQINQQVRIFGIQVGIDEEGNERLGQLQLYPGG